MEIENDLNYDDDEAVKFIRNYLPQELKEKFSDDDVMYIVDLVYEFYESKGYLSGADDTEVEIDEDELIQYVVKNAARDDVGKFTSDEITWVVQGELAYCDSIDLFE
ncbi:MAG: hypothetical protein LBT78_06730 [Tannerella sp.]|jgi:hypothetical protein|nr:hypothetical protein [Tannerella sp.]